MEPLVTFAMLDVGGDVEQRSSSWRDLGIEDDIPGGDSDGVDI